MSFAVVVFAEAKSGCGGGQLLSGCLLTTDGQIKTDADDVLGGGGWQEGLGGA